MTFNYLILVLAALIPMVMGFIWYHPKVMGGVWMREAGMTEEKIKGGNMALIFGLSFVLAILLAVEMNFIVIHLNHLYSVFFHELDAGNEEIEALIATIENLGGGNHRSFSHGAFHGVVAGIFFALPILATNAMFERKSFKYILVNGGYWIITIALMGGVICQWG